MNKALLIGRLGRDPEIKYTQSGNAIANLNIATSEKWTDQAGEKQEKTEWHSVVAFGKLADICSKYLVKGSKVFVEGKIQTRSWEQDGQTRYKTEIVMGNMEMLSEKQKQYDEPPVADRQPTGTYDPEKDDIPF